VDLDFKKQKFIEMRRPSSSVFGGRQFRTPHAAFRQRLAIGTDQHAARGWGMAGRRNATG
jgi:hypothetical protein